MLKPSERQAGSAAEASRKSVRSRRPRAESPTSATKLFVLDTNVLMHDPTSLFRFEEHDVFLPIMTLEELDNNKSGISEIARNARQASRFLDDIVSHAKTPIAEGIPLARHEADIGRKVVAPLLVLWGKHGTVARCFSPLADWAERAESVQGRTLDCGHYIPEEAPVELLGELVKFLS